MIGMGSRCYLSLPLFCTDTATHGVLMLYIVVTNKSYRKVGRMKCQVRSVESIRAEIRTLLGALNQSTVELKRAEKQNMWLRVSELLSARIEIYKSIAHRQGLIIEMQDNELKFYDRKVA